MRRIASALTASVPRRPVPATLLLAALISVLVAAGGCRFVARGPFAGRAAPGDSAVADSAVARDTLVQLDTVAVDSALARAARAAARTGRPRGDTAAVPDSVAARRGAPPDSLPPDSVVRDSVAADSLPPADRYTVEQLREMGPTYTPYDISPRLLPGEWLTDLLSDTLAPVVDRHDQLSVEHSALFWVLVDRNGEAREAVLHTTSNSAAFDEAARVVARRLRFRPAVADGEPVPVWVLKRISLLMR